MVYLQRMLQLGTGTQVRPITETGSEMGGVAHSDCRVLWMQPDARCIMEGGWAHCR